MKRIGLLVTLVTAVMLGTAGFAAAAETDVRVVQFTAGFRQGLVDITRVTYDPETGEARIYFTAHCFTQSFSPDPEIPPTVGQSSVGPVDWTASQRGASTSGFIGDGSVIALDPDPSQCDRDYIAVIPNLRPGGTLLTLSVTQIAFSVVTTTATLRVVLPAR